MSTRLFLIESIVALLIGPALAADIDGKWAGVVRTNEGGEFDLVLTLKTEGSTVTGTFRQGDFEDAAIQDGKIEGDQIRFTVTRSTPERTLKMNFSGAVTGNQMKLKRTIEGAQRSLELTLTKK